MSEIRGGDTSRHNADSESIQSAKSNVLMRNVIQVNYDKENPDGQHVVIIGSDKGPQESKNSSGSKCTSKRSSKKILEIKLDAAKKKAALYENIIDLETEIKLAELRSTSSRASNTSEMSALEKVNNWLLKSPSEIEKIPLKDENKSETNITETYGRNNLETFFTRQTIKDLPKFNGDPEDWPLFISKFRATTKSCGFSDEENIVRLEKCLHGRAREVVKPLLISSSNLQTIMETLEMTFGRADIIIANLIEKARRAIPPSKGKADSLVVFSNLVTNLTSTIEVLEANYHMQNPQLLDELLRKLPYFLRLDWGENIKSNLANRNLKIFSDWLKEKAKVSCLIEGTNFKQEDVQKNLHHVKKKETVFSVSHTKNQMCSECEGKHSLEQCEAFKRKSCDERWKFVTEKKLCICCLKKNHFKSKCYKKIECNHGNCRMIHHPLLHKPNQHPVGRNEQNPNEQVPVEHISLTQTEEYNVILKMLPVTLKGQYESIHTYAFLDDGSTISIIDSTLADKLNLIGEKEPICYQWTNGIVHEEKNSKKVELSIKRSNSSVYFNLREVRTVENLKLPKQSVDVELLKQKYGHIKELTEISSYFNEQPLILIGQDNCHLINPRKIIEVHHRGPILSQTRLGWVIHGRNAIDGPNNETHFLYHICNKEEYEQLDELVKNSFSLENFGVKIFEKTSKTKDDQRCENIMEETTKRIGQRFETGLLWKNDKTKFPNNIFNALSRLYCLERKMDKNDEYAEQYIMKIEEYLKKGYARKLSKQEIENTEKNKVWYLPHFGVINPNKPKLRLVFDAAAKTDGISLNTQLLSGPDLLRPLTGVLLTFRQNKIAFIGDIKEMFHQVVIRTEDRTAQRFLFRGRERRKDPEVYEMCVMTFGATCSPCLAQYVKNKNAKEHEEEYPAASKAILKKHYVDDYLDSKSTEIEAIEQIRNVIKVHKRGGFEICGFTSNSRKVLESIPAELRSKSIKNAEEFIQIPDTERVLGLKWHPKEDEFIFSMDLRKVNQDIVNGGKVPTKRELLKFAMSVFDPLGFLGSVSITIKIILQEIWKIKIGWDDEIPKNLYEYWSSWIRGLQTKIQSIKFQRCYGKFISLDESDYTEIHCFSDASEKAYCAVVYIRFKKKEFYEISFLMSKTRVAPLKSTSIPRLELQAALLASRLVDKIKKELEVEVNKTFFWTDSKTVLQWIRADHIQYKTFVAHRVEEIRELTKKEEWYWISTNENVADEGTRLNKEAVISDRWKNGPHFFKEKEHLWPKQNEPHMDISPEDLEIKKLLIQIIKPEHLPKVERFSSYEKLVRTTAWVLRFIQNVKNVKNTSPLGVHEIVEAEKLWFKQVQAEFFAEEINDITKNKEVRIGSNIYKLSPILEDGLLCMKGRIWGEIYNEDFRRNLIILDIRHRFTKLLVEHYHLKAKHNGYEYVMNEIRQNFWIPKLRNAVKKIWKNCQFCKVRRAKPLTPEMGELPSARLTTFAKPFSKTGVDYFGPFKVTVARRHELRYGVIFTCMTTRAVHIEVAWSLDTASVILSLKRLIARRGSVLDLYSDNGTNFHGAENELKNILRQLDQTKLQEFTTSQRINWHFSAAKASHMGGCWERLIRSIRRSLIVILKERYPKDEVLITAFAEIEHMINSRPLTYVSSDPNFPESLTPNHFLFGSGTGNFPDTIVNPKEDYRKRWKTVQVLTELFWKRWIKEYRPELMKRQKWHKKEENLKVGDVVLIVDENLPRNSWPLGRVTKCYPGRDQLVRVVDVKTKLGTYRRPVVKLCKLDLENGEESSRGEDM